jgi:hypothetical protein
MMPQAGYDVEELSPSEQSALRKLTDSYNSREVGFTEEEQVFITEKLSSKLWRMNNLYTILDKNGVKKKLKLNHAQLTVLTKFRHNKKIILKTRQQGISTLYLAYNLDDCLFKPGYQAGIQSYGLDESEKLSKRALLMWNDLDENIKRLFDLEMVTNNSKGMSFSNGSVLKIGNFRGDTLQSLHVSELAKIAAKYPEKAKELKTGAFQAVGKDNKITLESTSEGKSGLFWEIWNKSTLLVKLGKKLGPFDFEPIFLSWVYDPDCSIDHEVEITQELSTYFGVEVEKKLGIVLTIEQKWWYASKLDELGVDMKREYPTTAEEAFEQSVEGAYYREEYKKLKILPNLYDPNLMVHSAVDLGMNDTFSIGFFQKHPNGQEKIIGEYANHGKGLEHYWHIFLALTAKFGWEHGDTYVPHDVAVHELIADKTRFQAMEDLGFNPVLVTKHKLADGIEATRQFLKRVEIDDSCELIVGAIQNYRQKYDNKFAVFLDAPVHDEWSHPADMIRYMAMGCKNSPVSEIWASHMRRVRLTSTRLMTGKGHDV